MAQETDQRLPVTMQELYQYMKDVLDHFGLRFHEMDKVRVGIHVSQTTAELVFSYGNKSHHIDIIAK